MDGNNISEVLNLVNKVLGDQNYTNEEKAILILLYLYNDKIDTYKLHKMAFLASLNIKELRDEMEPKPMMYKDIFYDSTITETLESLKLKGLIEGDSTFILSTRGKEEAQFLLSNISDQEKRIFEQTVNLFKDTTDDEILAIFYFTLDGMIKIINPLYRVTKNRKELAISLYQKGKISFNTASEIAGMDTKDFVYLLKKKIIFS
jgi:predicted HTH domain antitoxin